MMPSKYHIRAVVTLTGGIKVDVWFERPAAGAASAISDGTYIQDIAKEIQELGGLGYVPDSSLGYDGGTGNRYLSLRYARIESKVVLIPTSSIVSIAFGQDS